MRSILSQRQGEVNVFARGNLVNDIAIGEWCAIL